MTMPAHGNGGGTGGSFAPGLYQMPSRKFPEFYLEPRESAVHLPVNSRQKGFVSPVRYLNTVPEVIKSSITPPALSPTWRAP